MLRVSVTDPGKGIAPQEKQKLFKAFGKLTQEDATLNQEGVGMGLAICKRIVQQSGGFIDVYSEGEGHGSTFVFGIKMQAITTNELDQQESSQLLSETAFTNAPYIGHGVDEGLITLDKSMTERNINEKHGLVSNQGTMDAETCNSNGETHKRNGEQRHSSKNVIGELVIVNENIEDLENDKAAEDNDSDLSLEFDEQAKLIESSSKAE